MQQNDFDMLSLERWLIRIRLNVLTHWVRVTYICVDNLTINGPDKGVSPSRRQDIIWTNASILLFESLGTN